jgi:hypothetical protein
MRRAAIASGIGALALAAFIGFVRPAAAATTGVTVVTGTLTVMSGTTVPAVFTVTSGATTYTVNVSATTKIVRKFNGTSDLGEFTIGDSIQVTGKLSNDVANTIDATKIKDLSIQRIGGTFKGAVVATACGSSSFTFKPDGRVQQTVKLTAATKITRGGTKIACADLVAGERTKVIGVWNKTNSTVVADRVVVDMKTISGTIASITPSDGTLPATITVTVKGKSDKVKASDSSSTPTTTWTVNVTTATKLYRHYLKTATIAEFLVGDKVEARGTVSAGNIMNAKYVRNSSLTIKNGDYQGTVLSVNATAKTFVIRVNGKVDGKKFSDVTVTTTDATKYVDENGMRAFTDLTVGERVKVLGSYNSSTKKLAATRVFFKEAQDIDAEDDD